MIRFVLSPFICISLVSIAICDDRAIRFNRDVRSILTDNCFACHGPDAKTVEADLRLDLRDQAVAGDAIVPGKPDESALIDRIFSDDPDTVMPPPETNKTLSDDEKEILKSWISQGAEYEDHWAYTSMTKSELLKSHSGNPSAMIDAAIDARVADEKITPTERADRVTLIRRLSFDLTGMPPTIAEVDAFVDDASPDAYAKLVDRLLRSPRFGERMAIYWLDLVRYADTVGYHGDQDISQSPYRDYVIKAFNDNMPYDRFIREQLAGDLLENATLDQQVASGYNRLNQTTEEGGSQAKEYLAIYFADRVRNVSQVYLGATMGCAQCHDHKYDPYTSKDFYSFGAFFADLDERGVYSARSRPPVIRVPTEELKKRIEGIDKQLADLRAKVQPLKDELLKSQADWEAKTLAQEEDNSEVETAWVDDEQKTGGKSNGDWKFVGPNDGPVHSGKFSRKQQSDGLVQHFFDNANPKTKIEPGKRFFAWVNLDPKNPPKAIMIQLNDGNWEHRYVWGSDDIPYGKKKQSHAGYFRAGSLPETGKWVRLEVEPSKIGLADGREINGMAFTQFGGLTHWDKAGWITGSGTPKDILEILAIEPDKRTEDQTNRLRDRYFSQAEPMKALLAQVADAENRRKTAEDAAPLTVVSKAVKPRDIRILPRGNWLDDSGELVTPAIPEFLGKLDLGQRRANRLDLANWICDPQNPLTARTMVNRMWSLLFGRGICTSVDDFGGQGTFPSYPDLLDALALEFIESDWNIKQMMRAIVLSDAYQRSSKPTDDLKRQDPYNDLFARQGRFCIDAEMVRDSALACSGLLVEKVGGRSAKPYQPAGYYAQLNFPKRIYKADGGENQYRRGLYTHWQRTFLHPMLKAFDAPSREECTAARARSNTPLQALVLLNDPTFVEAARVMAARIMREGGKTTKEKIDWAYRLAISRKPQPKITDELRNIYNEHLGNFKKDTEGAKKLIAEGDAKVESELDAAELAAWTSVSRVILNLHETITRY